MRNIWLIIKSNIKRNRGVVILSVFGGLLLCLLIHFMGIFISDTVLSKVKIGVMDCDRSLLSENFKSYLTGELDYELIEDDSDYLSKLLNDKEISVIIEIPEGFYDKFASGEAEKITITSTDDFENAAFTEAYMNSYLESIRMLSAGSDGDKETFISYLNEYEQIKNTVKKDKAFNLDTKQLKDKEGFRSTIGFYLMIVFSLAMVVSITIVDDRRTGVYNRIAGTPVKAVQYMAGNSIFGFSLLMLEALIYCGFIGLMNKDIGFPVYKLFLLYMLFSFFIICFVIDVSLVIKSRIGNTTFIMSYNTLGAILGGAYFPLDLAPEYLQNLAKILPQYWIVDTLHKLMDNPGADISSNIIILVLFTVLAFLIGAVLFSQNYKRG